MRERRAPERWPPPSGGEPRVRLPHTRISRAPQRWPRGSERSPRPCFTSIEQNEPMAWSRPLRELLVEPLGGSVRTRGHRRSDPGDGALAHAANVRLPGRDPRVRRRRLRERRVPVPRALVEDAVAAASGIEAEVDPWRPERAVWPLLEVVDESLDEAWLHSLAVHLGRSPGGPDEIRRSRRLTAVRHIADLFDRYALHRPEMLRAWAERDDVDGSGAALPDDAVWQAELWRRLRARLGQPSPAERLDAACERLRAEPSLRGPAGALLALRSHTAAARPASGAPRARGQPRRAPLPASPIAGAVGCDRFGA